MTFIISNKNDVAEKPPTKNNVPKASLDTMKLWPQVLVAITASLAHLGLGTVLAYPAISVPELSTPDGDNLCSSKECQLSYTVEDYVDIPMPLVFPQNLSTSLDPLNDTLIEHSSVQLKNISDKSDFFPTFFLSNTQIAWFASAHTTGAILGSICCGPLISAFGRRRSVLITCPVVLISWLAIWASPMFTALLVARLLLGVCIGINGTAAQVYVVETAHESVRGSLTCMTDFFVGIGLLFTYVLGITGLGWRWSAFTLGLVTTLPLCIGFSMFPDSPRWLLTKGRRDSAAKALEFLRGSRYDVSAELQSIESKVRGDTFCQQMQMLKSPMVYKPFLTACGLFICVQFSGSYVVYSYAVTIFQAADVGLSPYLSTVLVGVARVIGSGVGIVVVERAGRRLSLIVGTIGTSASLICLAIYFSLMRLEGGASSCGWLAIGSMISYTMILGGTLSPISFLLSSELLPLSFRSLGSAANKAVFSLAGMLATLSFPLLKEAMGPDAVFGLYAAFVLLVFLVVWKMPETKGRSLEEIEEYYRDQMLRAH